MVAIAHFCGKMLIFSKLCDRIPLSDYSDVKGKTENSVKAGRLCHLFKS